jgi:hypothetical protein
LTFKSGHDSRCHERSKRLRSHRGVRSHGISNLRCHQRLYHRVWSNHIRWMYGCARMFVRRRSFGFVDWWLFHIAYNVAAAMVALMNELILTSLIGLYDIGVHTFVECRVKTRHFSLWKGRARKRSFYSLAAKHINAR